MTGGGRKGKVAGGKKREGRKRKRLREENKYRIDMKVRDKRT